MVGLAIIAVSLAPFRSGLYKGYFGIIRYYSASIKSISTGGSCCWYFLFPYSLCGWFLWLVVVLVGCFRSVWAVVLCQLNCLIELFFEIV